MRPLRELQNLSRTRRALRRLIASGEAREIRLAAGLTLREVGEAVGVAPSTVFRWEAGQRTPRAAAARYLALLEGIAEGLDA